MKYTIQLLLYKGEGEDIEGPEAQLKVIHFEAADFEAAKEMGLRVFLDAER